MYWVNGVEIDGAVAQTTCDALTGDSGQLLSPVEGGAVGGGTGQGEGVSCIPADVLEESMLDRLLMSS